MDPKLLESLVFTLKCIEKQLTRIADAMDLEVGKNGR